MTEHYYAKNPTVKSNPTEWTTEIRGKTLRFKTDTGVFSKGVVDFGSRLLVESFDLPSSLEGAILDVGCGYGPIGLTIAASFPERQVQMVDVNERALRLAAENAQLNCLSNTVIFESDALTSVQRKDFAAIVTNPPIRAGKETIFRIYEGAYDKLKQHGELWIVIQKKQGAPSTQAFLMEKFGNVDVVEKKKGYFILKAKKG